MKVNYNEYIDTRLNKEIRKAKKENKKIKSFILTPNEYNELQTRPVKFGGTTTILADDITKYNGIDIFIEVSSEEDR